MHCFILFFWQNMKSMGHRTERFGLEERGSVAGKHCTVGAIMKSRARGSLRPLWAGGQEQRAGS